MEKNEIFYSYEDFKTLPFIAKKYKLRCKCGACTPQLLRLFFDRNYLIETDLNYIIFDAEFIFNFFDKLELPIFPKLNISI